MNFSRADSPRNNFPKFKRVAAAVALTSVLMAGLAVAEDVWINAELVQIRSGKGAVYPVIATAQKGAKLTVVDHEGKWIKVTVPDAQGQPQDGYVFENSISPTEVSGGGNLLANMGAGANASDLSTGAAGKGLAEDAETYAHNKNLDPAPLQKLVDFRKAIDPKLWTDFTAAGKVGPDAPNAQQ